MNIISEINKLEKELKQKELPEIIFKEILEDEGFKVISSEQNDDHFLLGHKFMTQYNQNLYTFYGGIEGVPRMEYDSYTLHLNHIQHKDQSLEVSEYYRPSDNDFSLKISSIKDDFDLIEDNLKTNTDYKINVVLNMIRNDLAHYDGFNLKQSSNKIEPFILTVGEKIKITYGIGNTFEISIKDVFATFTLCLSYSMDVIKRDWKYINTFIKNSFNKYFPNNEYNLYNKIKEVIDYCTNGKYKSYDISMNNRKYLKSIESNQRIYAFNFNFSMGKRSRQFKMEISFNDTDDNIKLNYYYFHKHFKETVQAQELLNHLENTFTKIHK